MYEIYTEDVRSKKLVIRESFWVHFFSRPAFIAGKMESSMKEKTGEALIDWLEWCQSLIDQGKTVTT